MKRVIALLLVSIICLSLCSCGKSDAVKAVEEAISQIGDVSIDSGDAIAYAEKLYDILTDKEKTQVENRLVLTDAVDAYEKVVEAETERLRLESLTSLKAIYADLKDAYAIVDQYGADLYTAWQLGIQQKEQFKGANLNGSMKYLDSKLFLDYDDLLDGATYALIVNVYGSDWDSKSDEVKQNNRNAVATGTLFYMCSNNIPTACVCTVTGAYLLNGSVENVNDALNSYISGKAVLSQNDDLSEELNQIEQMYIAIKSYLDYCQNPTGSFNQSSQTINGYRNTVRDCISSLDVLLPE